MLTPLLHAAFYGWLLLGLPVSFHYFPIWVSGWLGAVTMLWALWVHNTVYDSGFDEGLSKAWGEIEREELN